MTCRGYSNSIHSDDCGRHEKVTVKEILLNELHVCDATEFHWQGACQSSKLREILRWVERWWRNVEFQVWLVKTTICMGRHKMLNIACKSVDVTYYSKWRYKTTLSKTGLFETEANNSRPVLVYTAAVDIILKPLCTEVPSFVTDDMDFLHHIPDTDITLSSFDVTNLYTNIPHTLGLKVAFSVTWRKMKYSRFFFYLNI
jgi:hypothetical protein